MSATHVDTKTQDIANAYQEEVNKYRQALVNKRMFQIPSGLEDKMEKARKPNKIRGPLLQLIKGIELNTQSLEATEILIRNMRNLPFRYTGCYTSGKSILERDYRGDCRNLSEAMYIILKDFFEIDSQLMSINKPIVCINRPILGLDFEQNEGLLLFSNHHWIVVAGKEFDPLFGSSLTHDEKVVVNDDNKEQVENLIDLHGKTDREKDTIKDKLRNIPFG